MAETTQFVSRISVKDLITAFENKSETVRVEFSRPRARSFGNVLTKNVVVRLNEFTTLEDVEKGLTKLETSLNFYEVYNKAKHVAFQEQFFNILTSIANIENDDEDAPTRKKRLISRTQTLVSFLNQKLPSNINQVVENKPKSQYIPYSSYAKSKATESNSTNSEEPKQSNGAEAQPALFVESNGAVDVTDSSESYFVSVKKLKETFQQKSDQPDAAPIKQEKVPSKTIQKASEAPKVQSPEPTQNSKQTKEQPVKEDLAKEEKIEAVSVTKLRSLFEQGSQENSKGLEIITVEKSQLTKNILGGSIQNISIPFTERNLGTFRLQRSVSGNYMNYSGLLKRVDINRSTSSFELGRENVQIVSESLSDENSDGGSENTLENRDDSIIIEEIKENGSPKILENQDEPITYTSETHHVTITKKSAEAKIKYSSKSEQEENIKIEQNILNGVGTLSPEKEEHISLNSEQSSKDEEEITTNTNSGDYSSSDVSFHSADETEVNSGSPVTKNVQEEDIAKLQATAVAETSENANRVDTTHELIFKGVDEIEVNSGTAKSKNIQLEENTATIEAVAEVPEIATLSETTGNDIDNVRNDETGSAFSSLLELEDEAERSLIEEEMKKIDVEQTLANADLVVNPEDLKNADDEFEKLMENTESGKITG